MTDTRLDALQCQTSGRRYHGAPFYDYITGAKAVIRYKLKARSFENQNTEAKVCVRVLNRVTELGRPNLERPA